MEKLIKLINEINKKYIQIDNLKFEDKKNAFTLIDVLEHTNVKIKIYKKRFLENLINIKLFSELIIESKLAYRNQSKEILNFYPDFEKIKVEILKLEKILKVIEIYFKGIEKKEFLFQELYNLLEPDNKIFIQKLIQDKDKIILIINKNELIFEKTDNGIYKERTFIPNINIKLLKKFLNIFS